MNNPIVKKFLENGLMELNVNSIEPAFILEEKIRSELVKNKMKVMYHFNKGDGTLVFDKVLGRDNNDDFYNDKNGNLEIRKEEIKKIIVTVLVNEYNK